MKWLYDNWMRATPFLAFYCFVLVFLYVRDVNYALYLIWVQTIVYWVHEFEEYIYPSGFLDYFNHYAMRSKRGDYPLTKISSFWINIPLVYIAMPLSAVLANFWGVAWGLWAAYFSVLNAMSHVGMAVIFRHRYNPGLIASVMLNIPVGIYMIWYFISNNLVSWGVNIASIIVGILAQASMMIYGFGVLAPRVKRTQHID